MLVSLTAAKQAWPSRDYILHIKDQFDTEHALDKNYHPVLRREKNYDLFYFINTSRGIEFYYFTYADEGGTAFFSGNLVVKTTDDADGKLVFDDIIKSAKFVDGK